jgi:hypothetical protein
LIVAFEESARYVDAAAVTVLAVTVMECVLTLPGLAARTATDLERTAAAIEEASGRRCLLVPTDVKIEDQVVAMVAHTVDELINVDLPIGEPDPLVRLDRISSETRQRKRLDDADELYEFFHALGRVKRVEKVARRLAGSAREFSLSISNVPGPRSPVGVAGRRVQHLFSSSEPGAHHALRIRLSHVPGISGSGCAATRRPYPTSRASPRQSRTPISNCVQQQ